MRLWKLVAPTIAAALVAALAWGGIFDHSKTAASNTTIESISAAVGAMPPSNVGPLFRAYTAAVKKWQEDIGCAVSTTGSANAYVFDANSNPYSGAATFAAGDSFCFVANFTNSSTATLNVESEGAKAIRKDADAALASGDIVSGSAYPVHYCASCNSSAGAWLLESLPPSSGTIASALLTTRGDLIRRSASAPERVALGASGLVLKSDGTDAVWGNPVEAFCVAASDEVTTIVTGTDRVHWRMPYAFTVTGIRGTLTGASTSGTFTADVHESGTTIMATNKLVFDQSEETTTTAATAPTVSDTSLADDAEMSIDVDDDGTSAEGLKVCLIGTRS